MKVLMFGWEYPPHVYGGLATANFGISEGLHAQGDVDITLCLPKPWGDEDHTFARIVAMNCVPIAYRDVNYDYVKSAHWQPDGSPMTTTVIVTTSTLTSTI
jgi:glycogen(starch) synthase